MNKSFIISPTTFDIDSNRLKWTLAMYKWWCCIALLLLMSSNVTADYITWTGAGDQNSWSDPLNWDSGQVPATIDMVSLPISAIITIKTGEHFTITKLVMGSTLTIESGASLTVDGADIFGITTNGQINNYGTLTVKTVDGMPSLTRPQVLPKK